MSTTKDRIIYTIVAIAVVAIIVVIVLTTKHLIHLEGFARIRAGDNYYKVHEDLDNPTGAASIMDRLNTSAIVLIDRLNSKYLGDGINEINPQYQQRVKNGVDQLKTNYRPSNLEENLPQRSGGDTSYVVNKGNVFAMCLRDPKNGNQLDHKINDLTFVMLHELSHLFTRSYGHDIEFWANFRFILQEAVAIGVYYPVNYKNDQSPYCGIVISYSPLFDQSLVDYKANVSH